MRHVTSPCLSFPRCEMYSKPDTPHPWPCGQLQLSLLLYFCPFDSDAALLKIGVLIQPHIMRIHESSCFQLWQGLGKQTPVLAPEKDCEAQAHPSSYMIFCVLRAPQVRSHLSVDRRLHAVNDSRDQRSVASVRPRE